MEEQVLVFPAINIDGIRAGITTDPTQVRFWLDRSVFSGDTFFMSRDKAEKDPSLKQVIPYVIFQRPDGTVYAYERTKKGGESRLHSKWSVGVGGHINPQDVQGKSQLNDEAMYYAAMQRELMEEVQYVANGSPKTQAPIVGIIYDPSDDVGKVHFGVCHLLKVPAGTVLHSKDPALAGGQWLDTMDLLSKNLENWSRMAQTVL